MTQAELASRINKKRRFAFPVFLLKQKVKRIIENDLSPKL